MILPINSELFSWCKRFIWFFNILAYRSCKISQNLVIFHSKIYIRQKLVLFNLIAAVKHYLTLLNFFLIDFFSWLVFKFTAMLNITSCNTSTITDFSGTLSLKHLQLVFALNQNNYIHCDNQNLFILYWVVILHILSWCVKRLSCGKLSFGQILF